MARRTQIHSRTLAIITVVLLLCSVGHGMSRAKPVTHASTIEGTQFQPDVLSVARGDSIVWTNKDPFPHTVTSKSGGFDSQQIQPGESWTFRPLKAGRVRVRLHAAPDDEGDVAREIAATQASQLASSAMVGRYGRAV